MRILKRLSLTSTISNRQSCPKPVQPALSRYLYNKHKKQLKLTPQQQLSKYGWTTKPKFTSLHFYLSFAAVTCALFLHYYLVYLYKNQIYVRNRYRVAEIEHSSLILRARRALFRFSQYLESRVFFSEFMFDNKSKKVETVSEVIIRAEQYANYMKYKDRRFDFMDIGVMEKYPFPQEI